MQIPPYTILTLEVVGERRGLTYTATALGPSQWGMRLSLPTMGDRVVPLPAKTKVSAAGLVGANWVMFDALILGYERTEPPCMVLSHPINLRVEERRQALRLKKQIAVLYEVLGESFRQERTYTLDIGSGGIQIATGKRLDSGTRLHLTIPIPGHTLQFQGSVTWNRRGPLRAGVQFSGTPGTTQALWDRFIFSVERELAVSGKL